METEEIIDKISVIRERNNKNWMSILRLAIVYAPGSTKVIMRNITKCDQEITELIKELSE